MLGFQKEVPNMDLCLKLKQLGFSQKGEGWYWVKTIANWILVWRMNDERSIDYKFFDPQAQEIFYMSEKYDVDKLIKAPTVGELGEIVKPYGLPIWYGEFNKWRWFFNNYMRVETDGTEADARAEELIWLIKNKEVTL